MAAKSMDYATGQQITSRKRKAAPLQEQQGTQDKEDSMLPLKKKEGRWTNKERVLVFCSRGICSRPRHLMLDLMTLLPHSKTDVRFDKKDQLQEINEVCEMKNCKKCIFFQMRKKQDLYMWMSATPDGPSVNFHIQNLHTMSELKMTGNCIKGSRPLLTFDAAFDSSPHYQLLKELFIQVFSTPCYHPKSRPFIDHVLHFALLDDRIWFRNFQIVGGGSSLTEIGPRFVMNPVKIFEGSFGGPTLYENPKFVSPNVHRSLLKQKAGMKYKNKMVAKKAYKDRSKQWVMPEDPYEQLFANPTTSDGVEE